MATERGFFLCVFSAGLEVWSCDLPASTPFPKGWIMTHHMLWCFICVLNSISTFWNPGFISTRTTDTMAVDQTKKGIIMSSFQKAAATGERNTNVSEGLLVSCHLQQKRDDYILSATDFFFFFPSIWISATVWLIQQQSAPTPSAPLCFSVGSQPRCRDTHNILGRTRRFICMRVPMSGCAGVIRLGVPNCTHVQESGKYFMSCCLLHNISQLNGESINLG